MFNLNFKSLAGIVASLALVIYLFIAVGYNQAGMITVQESRNGKINVYTNNEFYSNLTLGTVTKYKQYITINYSAEESDASVNLKPINIRFNDGSSADASGVVRFVLPMDPVVMKQVHNAFRTQENLVASLLKPFTTECLKNSAQLMSSEMHYSSGRSIMSQNFQDQLENGVYSLQVDEKLIIDSLTKENKRIYLTEIIKDKSGQPLRKKSGLQVYKISTSDANISDVDYEPLIDEMLKKKIESTTRASVSKQNLMTAQQEAQTKEAEGKKKLVEIEYAEKQNQTKDVIQAETRVKLAEQDKLEQKIAYEAAQLEAAKKKTLADAEAYQKQKVMQADGALEMKLKYQAQMNQDMWDAFSKYNGPSLVPSTVMGGGSGGKEYNALEMMMNLQMMNQFSPKK
jgi:hypothetical protein